jgi:hypothetical protein
MTKIFTVATITDGLEQDWLQHLRDFDIAHPGCHFRVGVSAADQRSITEIVDMLHGIDPPLPVKKVIKFGD